MNQVSIGQRIKGKREQHGLSLQFVADKLDVNRSSVMRWENGETGRIKLPMLERLAQILKTTPEYLMGYTEDDAPCCEWHSTASENACLIPVFSCFPFFDAELDDRKIVGYELAKAEYRYNCFFMQISEDSMAPRLDVEDLVLIHRQSELQNGDLGIFLLDGKNYLIRVFQQEDLLELRAFNPYYPSLRLTRAEAGRVQIMGKVLESRRSW